MSPERFFVSKIQGPELVFWTGNRDDYSSHVSASKRRRTQRHHTVHLVDDWASTGVEIAQSRLGPVRFLSLNTGILDRNSGPENGTINRPIFRPQNHDERSVTTPSVTLRWSINRYRQAVR